jgi:ribosome-associated protein
MIRLGQLLKVAGIVDSGGEAKALIAEGGVTVNGEPETRRGRQMHAGDTLVAAGHEVRLV